MKKIYKEFLTVCIISLFTLSLSGQEKLFEFDKKQNVELNQSQETKLLKIRASTAFTDEQLVTLNTINDVIEGNTVYLNLPNSETNLAFVYSNIISKDKANFSWLGTSKTDVNGSLLYVKKGYKVFGQVNYKGEVWEFTDLGEGLHVLYRLNDNLLKGDCGMVDTTTKSESRSESFSRSVECAPRGEVSVLVLYTPNADASVPDIDATANLSIAQLQQALSGSQVDVSRLNVELVDVLPLAFNESGDIVNDVGDLSANVNAQNLRQTNNADLVLLLTDGNYGTIVGIADAINADFQTGYAIAQANSATGNLTFAHELGHLFGGRHDNDPTGTIEHGYVMNSTRGTIMARQQPIGGGQNRILRFSNPNVYFGGQGTGTFSFNDNKTEYENNGPAIADFFPNTIPQISTSIDGPYSVCENTSATFEAEVNCGQPSYTYLWETSQNGINWDVVGTSFSYTYNAPYQMNGNFNFTLRLTVTDAANTITVSQRTITAVDPPPGFACAPYRINAPETVDTFIVYPNPAKGYEEITVEFDKKLKNNAVQVNIIDFQGRTLYRHKINELRTSNKEHIKLDFGLSSGLFFIQVNFADGSSEAKTVQILN
ncbi:M12 family metallo-peptidase [Salegentibacter maritimus]|uniref:T9SS type A sorting domain-containing protein n=1 Tax=Salegentibacter maritimus TaxID=2794347 RepID=A0ABS0TCK5_9FLAO|nr:M12 family metallo-peptidase [Salegentibacter maritimus]MBI6118786.1 T9SS type A sorting domain-containing protein [Salegentibacter maritimus]